MLVQSDDWSHHHHLPVCRDTICQCTVSGGSVGLAHMETPTVHMGMPACRKWRETWNITYQISHVTPYFMSLVSAALHWPLCANSIDITLHLLGFMLFSKTCSLICSHPWFLNYYQVDFKTILHNISVKHTLSMNFATQIRFTVFFSIMSFFQFPWRTVA